MAYYDLETLAFIGGSTMPLTIGHAGTTAVCMTGAVGSTGLFATTCRETHRDDDFGVTLNTAMACRIVHAHGERAIRDGCAREGDENHSEHSGVADATEAQEAIPLLDFYFEALILFLALILAFPSPLIVFMRAVVDLNH